MNESPKWQWDVYFKVVPKLPKETLLKALQFFDEENNMDLHRTAIDIGCGHGPDTIELLKRGWNVLAIDAQEEGLEIIRSSILPEWSKKLELQQKAFEGIKLRRAQFINASLSLPFCKPEYFKNLWIEIEDSIFSNGRFAGHLFGKRDSWAEYDNMTFHTQPDIEKMFRHFSIEYFSEKEFDGFQAGGVPKHWHMYELVAKKK